MAEASTHPPSQREKAREELAFLEGHDADLPTNKKVDLPSKQSSPYASNRLRDVKKGADVEAGIVQTANPTQAAAEGRGEHPDNPNIVSWDGPGDPANPMNWSAKITWSHIAVVSSITLVTFVNRSELHPFRPADRMSVHLHPPCSRLVSRT